MTCQPHPIETSSIELPPAMLDLFEQLAEHNHKIRALGHIEEGLRWQKSVHLETESACF
tara:strand:+ start:249 stop:425 length:177 start_codon:yes stop_codon:yes gene_type:complete